MEEHTYAQVTGDRPSGAQPGASRVVSVRDGVIDEEVLSDDSEVSAHDDRWVTGGGGGGRGRTGQGRVGQSCWCTTPRQYSTEPGQTCGVTLRLGGATVC